VDAKAKTIVAEDHGFEALPDTGQITENADNWSS